MGTVVQKWKEIWGKISPVLNKIEEVIGVICRCIFRLRKVFMAIPVIYLAVQIANANMERLPEAVGLNLQSSGEFALMVTREYAVYGPLGITAFCLMLMVIRFLLAANSHHAHAACSMRVLQMAAEGLACHRNTCNPQLPNDTCSYKQ